MTRPIEFTAAFRAAASDIGLSEETIDRLGAELLARHREPHRRYHGVRHIEAVLGHLEALEANTPVTAMAAFFHDAIYDPRAGDNEERSADLADAWLVGLADAHEVAPIVRATAGHLLPDPAPHGCAAFLDADLAILGADADTYHWYTQAIAAEYAHLAPATFRNGRAGVLRHFLERPVLYFTDAGRQRWESAARRNLRDELDRLADPVD